VSELPPVIILTGTGTEVGKTVATAALAVSLLDKGLRVTVVKPTQTGLRPGEPGDIDEVRRLAGEVQTREFVRLRDPLAPDAAARMAGVDLPTVAHHADRLVDLAGRGDADVVLVEGAGGLLVRMDAAGATIADLGSALLSRGARVGYIVVATAGLGTLNHSALTAEALRTRGLDCLGFVIGAWPEEPDLAMSCNLDDLPAVTRSRLLGRIPAGAGAWEPERFRAEAPGWITVD
jgi:dethiobiotin synthetase